MNDDVKNINKDNEDNEKLVWLYHSIGLRKCPKCGAIWDYYSSIINPFFIHCPRCGEKISKGEEK